MFTEQKNNKKLKVLYEQSLQVKSAIPHPLIMGVIRYLLLSDLYRQMKLCYLPFIIIINFSLFT